MGVVYKAQDTKLDRLVALKFLPESLTASETERQRLIHEAKAASSLDHPNICTIHEIDETPDGRVFIAMAVYDGTTLDKKISLSPLKLDDLVDIAIQVAEGLHAAHEKKIVHRDIKSSNIMVVTKGQVKIMDFGLAKKAGRTVLTKVGATVGTVPYMSPEQARGEVIDHRTDIWSLGVVLYEMVSGRLPFKSDYDEATVYSILNENPQPITSLRSGIPLELERILSKCLTKNAADRYQHVDELIVDLRRVKSQIGKETFIAKPLSTVKRRLLIYVAASVSTLVTLLAVLLVFKGKEEIIRSIAVLPLENLSHNPEEDYFADGMTEALISNLAQIGVLRVISRTSVMQYKGVHKNLRDIARELNVDAVIEGSVMRSGNRVRITAQLISAPTENHLWARDYERDVQDVLTLQGEVARSIAKEIKIELTPSVAERLTFSRVVKPDAYDCFLRGRVHARLENRKDNNLAIELLEKAVALDPEFAPAHAELARAYGLRLFYFAPNEKEWDEKSLTEVEKALALDPHLADAYLARGTLLWSPRRGFLHRQAIQDFLSAINQNPSLDEAHHQLGLVYLHVGLLDQALSEAQEALKLNPANTGALYRTGVVLLYQQKYADAWNIFSRIPNSFNPSLVAYQNAWTLFSLGRKQEAIATTEEYLREYPEDVGGLVSSAQAMLAADAGNARRAQERINFAVEHGKGYGHFHHTAYNIACTYALMKKQDLAVRWLEAAAMDGFPCYLLFERDPNLSSLKDNPEYNTFMEGLRKQWESFRPSQ